MLGLPYQRHPDFSWTSPGGDIDKPSPDLPGICHDQQKRSSPGSNPHTIFSVLKKSVVLLQISKPVVLWTLFSSATIHVGSVLKRPCTVIGVYILSFPVEEKGYKNILDLPDWRNKHTSVMDREKPFKIAGFFSSRIMHLSISWKIFLISFFPVITTELWYD